MALIKSKPALSSTNTRAISLEAIVLTLVTVVLAQYRVHQQQQRALSPLEHFSISQLACNRTTTQNNTTNQDDRLLGLARLWLDTNGPGECVREPTAWRWKYVDEHYTADVLVTEESIDERLANIIYTATTSKLFDIDYYRFNSGDPKQDEHNRNLVAGPQVDDEQCGRHLDQMLKLVDDLRTRVARQRQEPSGQMGLDGRHIRLARALDSFGRYDSAHLSGRFQSLGSYEQCVTSRLVFNSSGPAAPAVQMRFCWARMRLDSHLDPSLRARRRTRFEIEKHMLLAGICVPDTCHSKSFDSNRLQFQQLVDGQFRLPESMYINETLELDSIFCLVDDKSQFGMPLSGKLFIVALCGWILVTIFATRLNGERAKSDENKRPTTRRPRDLVACLDLNESWKDFILEKESVQIKHVQLDALNSLKVFCCALVVGGHSLILLLGYALDELRALHQAESDPIIVAMFATTFIVDTFFVITGILLAYFAMKTLSKLAKSQNQQGARGVQTKLASFLSFVQQWFAFTLVRYTRIVPLFAIVFWFKKSVFIYLGSGPLWDFGFNKESKHGACVQESWITPFTFLSAYLPLSKQCLLQSWSISNDLFFSIFAPPIILLMFKRPKLATILSILACAASSGLSFVAISQVEPQIDWEIRDLRSFGFFRIYNIVSYLYTVPHYRVFSLLVGVFAGYQLFWYNERDKFQNWPKWFTGPATYLSFACVLITLAGVTMEPFLRAVLNPYHRLFYPQVMTNFRLLWASTNAVIFARMMTDWKDSRFVRMSATKFWKVFSRLNYAILLIHFDLLMFGFQMSTTTFIFSRWQYFMAASAAYVICLPISVFLHVFYENPIDKLIRSALFGNRAA